MQPIFEPGEALASGRIVLSSLTSASLAGMQSWLTASLAPDWDSDALEAQPDGVLISDAAGTPVGAAVARLNAPVEGTAALPFISIDPTRRYRGLGGEAALALERHLRDRFGVERVYAAIPDWRGLAVYFWLRQGYRPVTRTEAPWPLTGLASEPRAGIWMLRDSA